MNPFKYSVLSVFPPIPTSLGQVTSNVAEPSVVELTKTPSTKEYAFPPEVLLNAK